MWKFVARGQKTEPFDYFRERDALAAQYEELVGKAGIETRIARCERRHEPDYFEDRHLPPLFTKARQEADRRQDEEKFQSYRDCVRGVIFSVEDVGLRKNLITIDRKFHALKIKSFQKDLWAAQAQINEMEAPRYYESFFAAAVGAGIVMLGWKYGGPMGGTAALAFSLIMAMHGLYDRRLKQDRDVQRAKAEVADLAETTNVIVKQEVFSQLEEDIGEKAESIF